MKKKLKKIPRFKTEDEERDFWSTHSITDYFDMSHAVKVSFPNLKLSTETISIRFPKWLLDEIKTEANKRDIPYQSLIKVYLADHLSDVKNQYKTK
jgi:predicted DNA binding CopG/RHH family protein